MFRANLPRPRRQQQYRDATGAIGYVDFDFAGVIGEFDGKMKYRVPEGASPAEAGEIARHTSDRGWDGALRIAEEAERGVPDQL